MGKIKTATTERRVSPRLAGKLGAKPAVEVKKKPVVKKAAKAKKTKLLQSRECPWQASDSSCWLPSQPAPPTRCQLACCCLRGHHRHQGGRRRRAREDGSCQLTPRSPAH
ncbi:hypothetical protein KUCAC02_019682 [Chaenocephalus aceratus]|uniref:Uncharacterized protein n=1 Tax=Chaenocephalus aceratus TaxID=36190 RepID=A0ACB9VQX0_CHAAC|nr:hypothetical protein KUCAC02_019682 [Chaenocephalus aceratus]